MVAVIDIGKSSSSTKRAKRDKAGTKAAAPETVRGAAVAQVGSSVSVIAQQPTSLCTLRFC